MLHSNNVLCEKNTGGHRSSMILSKTCRFLIIISSIIIALISITQIMGEPVLHDRWETIISSLCLFLIGIYIICSYLHFNTMYLFTSAYIIMLSLFHLGIIIPDSLGIFDGSKWLPTGKIAVWYELAGWYTTLALACLGIGFGLSIYRSYIPAKSSLSIPRIMVERNSSTIFWDGIGLLCASTIFFVLAIQSFGDLTGYSRVEFFRTSKDTRGLGLFMMILPSAVTLLVIGANRLWEKKFAVIVSSISFLILLFSGFREAALFPLLIGIIIWVKVRGKISTILSLSIIAFVIMIIPVIKSLRVGPYNEISQRAIKSSMKSSSSKNTFIELGGTGGVLAHALRLVPEIDPFRYGMTYLRSIRSSIPNIMPTMSESSRAKYKQESLFDPSVTGNIDVPSDWITYRLDRDRFNKGEGLGFTAIGEPYINFGIIGVVIYFILLGFCLGCLDRVNLIQHPKMLIFVCTMLWHFMRTVRNDFTMFVKPTIFTIIILCVWWMATRLLFNNRI